MAKGIRLASLACLVLLVQASRPDFKTAVLGASAEVASDLEQQGAAAVDKVASFIERGATVADEVAEELRLQMEVAEMQAIAEKLGSQPVVFDAHLAGQILVVMFNLILSFGCSVCILIATWPFQGLMAQWFWTRHRYTWPTHVMMTWFDVGCIGLFCTNLYAIIVYPDVSIQLSEAGVSGGLPFSVWRGNFTVNCVMQGLWGLHNLHQWIIIMRGADVGTETEWRRPYPMFLWSLLGACGTGFVRNFITLWNGQVNDSVTWATGIYEVICLLLILVDLAYFLLFEHSCGANMSEDYGKAG